MKKLIALWLVCSFLAYGIFFARFQAIVPGSAEVRYRKEMSMAMGLGLIGGPISLLASLASSGFAEDGFKIK